MKRSYPFSARSQIEETMRARALLVLAAAASLSLASSRSGYPLPGAAAQERAAGAPGVAPPAPSPAGMAPQERSGRECGLHSLFVFLRLSGHDVTYDQTRAAVSIGPQGTSLLELQQAASRLGAKTAVSRCSMAELVQMPKPVIAHLRPAPSNIPDRAGHYVVVLNADETGVEAIDTTYAAPYWYPAPMWEGKWTGHILAPTPPRTWARPLTLTAVAGIWVGLGLYSWRAWVLRRAEAARSPAALGQTEGARP
jgi:hypothetical protein